MNASTPIGVLVLAILLAFGFLWRNREARFAIRELNERKEAQDVLRASQRELSNRARIAEIFSTMPEDDMYDKVLQVVLDATGSKHGVFGYINDDGALLMPSMTSDLWDQCDVPDKRLVFPRNTWGESQWPRAIRQKQTLFSNEPSTLVPEGHIAIRRSVSVPILYRREVIGLFLMANKETDYEALDIERVEAIAAITAPILWARLDRDRLERQRTQAEDMVASKNRDLETLLHVTSHDLREPLRAIQSFARLVDQRYASQLDDKGRDFLRRIVGGCERLDRLLDDVLMLSRVRRLEVPDARIDGRKVIDDVLRQLNFQIKQSKARVRVANDLPHFRADLRWATQAVYNLVANALKFTRPGEPPDVEIVGYRDAEQAGIVVRDRGPGVQPEYADRIFELFQRAVGHDIEGTGAGLAIVRQVAERHGGRAWVQARAEGGAEFIVTFGPSQFGPSTGLGPRQSIAAAIAPPVATGGLSQTETVL